MQVQSKCNILHNYNISYILLTLTHSFILLLPGNEQQIEDLLVSLVRQANFRRQGGREERGFAQQYCKTFAIQSGQLYIEKGNN